jgi:hypothetical protein
VARAGDGVPRRHQPARRAGSLSTYAGTDRSLGYGLGLDATERSNIIGVYLVSLIVGAVVFASRRDGEPAHRAHRAALLVGVGYALFLPFHRAVAGAR